MTDGREAAREPGELVRDVWVAWAREQPDVADHASWTVAWEALSARDREVDARIEATIRRDERERASESALRAAAREVVESQESLYCPCEPGCECSIPALKAALDGAPWEPSEEQVERAAEAGWRAIDTDDDWALIEEKNRAPWRIFAHAVLKAAMGSATTT